MFVAICVRDCFETLEDIKSSYKVLNLPLAKRIAKSNENLVNYDKKILFFLLRAHRGMGEDYPGEKVSRKRTFYELRNDNFFSTLCLLVLQSVGKYLNEKFSRDNWNNWNLKYEKNRGQIKKLISAVCHPFVKWN